MWFVAVTVALLFSTSIVIYFRWKYMYWKRIGVSQLNPKLLVGDFYDVILQKVSIGDKVQEFHDTFKSRGLRYGGVYFANNPIFVAVDPEIVRSILLKDSQHFIDRGIYHNEKNDPLNEHLFNIEGDKWRIMRAKVTPTFTSGRIKSMFQIVSECSEKLAMTVSSRPTEALDIKEILACFGTDVIASCAFGIECDSLNNPKEDFRKYGRKVFQNNILKGIKTALGTVMPSLLKAFNVPIFERDVTEYFMEVVRNNLDYRESNRVERTDFFNMLMQLQNKGEAAENKCQLDKASGLTFNELAAQAFVIFLGGFETSSTVMTFALYETSRNLEVQTKLRREINTVLEKYDGKVCYEALLEMPYLDGVLNESMRKYPPLAQLNRICTHDYQIPGSDIVVKKGVRALISVKGLHMDPEYFPNPELFDPERYSRDSCVPFTFLPFGDGPRVCIGIRFGLMQSKLGIITLIRNFEISLNTKTIPMILNPQAFSTTSKDGIYLDIKKI